MIKRTLTIPALIFFCLLPVSSQVIKQETGLKREVTLYNPYKPSLHEAKKRSFLPDMADTMKIRPDFHYETSTKPFMPEYSIAPLKAATLLPDPLQKLYKSFVNIGMGNYTTPLAELSITTDRSKKGTIGFYGRHFSSNGNIELENGNEGFAGYMDNDASVYGRRYLKKSIFESSVDFTQKNRYAYGCDKSITNYTPSRNDIRMAYYNVGGEASLSSLTADSADLSYKLDLNYNYFFNSTNLFQHTVGLGGTVAKSVKGLYIGSDISFDFYRLSDSILAIPEYTASIAPFIKKSTDKWSFKLGFRALVDKSMNNPSEFHIYPDMNFSVSIVPSFINLFAGLSGKLEKNEPLKIISENPFLMRDGTLFRLPDTDHEMIASAGFNGNAGLKGTYLLSVSYSMITDMLLYSNLIFSDIALARGNGNYFSAMKDDTELLNVHAELGGAITDKISVNGIANYYNYNLSVYDHAWNKPDWDGKLGVKYNLRNKIIAGMELTALGERNQVINGNNITVTTALPVAEQPVYLTRPVHFNLNLSAEYRLSPILSFWTKVNNISYDNYYEWALYPSQRFLCMVGFTYSL